MPSSDAPITNKDDLLAIFYEAAVPPERFRIGAEMEKFGVRAGTGAPVHYESPEGQPSVLAVLRALAERHGWAPETEVPGGPVLALSRDSAQVTLEPGGQLELSGAPLASLHEVAAELDTHHTELAGVSRALGVHWLGLGFHPFARRDDLTFVPKQRYPIMREYLPKRGGHALDMMLRTSTVQANFDYTSEADAMKKMRVALRLAPLTMAMFANSPWLEGKRHGGLTIRGSVWLDVDPDRSGLVPPLWSENASFSTYAEWALDVPMFLFKRDGRAVANTGQTFRSFLADGYQGHKATVGDWHLHLNTLFPEVRLKRTIEVRGADSQGARMAPALPALFTGVFYDAAALDAADALTADFEHAEIEGLRASFARSGLRANFRGAPLAKLAERIVELAEAGLGRRAVKRADGQDERVLLAPLKSLVARGACPADVLLESPDDSPSRIIADTKVA